MLRMFSTDRSWQELSDWIHIAPLQCKSHIWTAETFITYLDFLEGEIRAKRRSLELSHDSPCLVICDAATQHSSTRFTRLRETWSTRNNAMILCGSSPECSIPGGWGACGSPNDGFHQAYHCLAASYARVRMNWSGEIDLRKNLDQLQMAVQASLQTKSFGHY